METKDRNELIMRKLQKLHALPRNSFIGKAGHMIAVSAIVGFSVLGAPNATASISKSQNATTEIGQNDQAAFGKVIPLDQDIVNQRIECEGKFDCGDYKDCTVDIGCILYLTCESVQFPCIYGVYFPEW